MCEMLSKGSGIGGRRASIDICVRRYLHVARNSDSALFCIASVMCASALHGSATESDGRHRSTVLYSAAL